MLWIKNKVEVFQREIFSHRERRSFSTVLRKVENCELFKCFTFAKLFLSNAHLLKNGFFQNWKLLAKSGNILIICSEVLWMKKQYLQWFSVSYGIQHIQKILTFSWKYIFVIGVLCYLSFPQEHVPKPQSSPSGLTEEEDTGACFL